MKTYFIILLLLVISNCGDYDGYSAKSFYNDDLKEWFRNILKDLKCGGLKEVAIQMCIEETKDNRCEEAIKHCIYCPPPPSYSPKPLTPEEEKEKKRKKIEFWTNKLYKEYYPKLIEKFSEDEAIKQLIKIMTLVKKKLR